MSNFGTIYDLQAALAEFNECKTLADRIGLCLADSADAPSIGSERVWLWPASQCAERAVDRVAVRMLTNGTWYVFANPAGVSRGMTIQGGFASERRALEWLDAKRRIAPPWWMAL